jgi:hypothetical protein
MEEKFEAPPEDLKAEMDRRHEMLVKGDLYCNFCGKKQNEVKHLVAGPHVYICGDCISLCVDMLREKEPTFCQGFECPMRAEHAVIQEYAKTMQEAVKALKNLREGSA